MHRGYIKAWRAMKDHHLWKKGTADQRSIIMALLWMASHCENSWYWKGEKFTVKPGQMVTSIQSIREDAGDGTSIEAVRSALRKFKKYDFITEETTKTGRLITITNWALYQSDEAINNIDSNIDTTELQHRSNIATTPIKNVRIKECKNKSKKTSSEGSLADGEDATAPTPAKRPPTSYIQEFGEWYREMYSKIFGKPFIINWKRESATIKNLYEGCDKNMEELKSRAQCFLTTPETWPENDKSLKYFLENVNRMASKGKKKSSLFAGMESYCADELENEKNITPEEEK